ncbi:MAG TPA: M28 family peptidase [Pyrinomonadaceae bacterium]
MAFPQTFDDSTAPSTTYPQIKSQHVGLVVVFLLMLVAAGSIYLQNRLPAVPATAPATDFSAARASDGLRAISAQPHPIGSEAHANVRDFLFSELSKLGLAPVRQQSTSVNPNWGGPIAAGNVENILVKIPGTANSRAVLLVSHYDSAPASFGASDDGAGVVTLLETARALKSGPPLKNDVILLFTDGEEVGLLGSQAFVNEHPWAKDVGLFLNFEARGNGGPVYMFETTGGNGNLIRQFAKTSPAPRASSFFYEIYQRLPNDTDFTALKKLNAQGMNFAFIDGINHYHTSLDRLDELDASTLQQQGSYALALTQHFGNIDLNNIKSDDVVYFDLAGAALVSYSKTWIIPLLVLTTLLFAFVVVRGIFNNELRVTGILAGIAALVAGVIISAGVCWLIWNLIDNSFRYVPWGEPYNSNIFRLGFVCVTIAAVSGIYALLRRRMDALSLMVGACFLWLLASIASAVVIPGGSYLFTIPLLLTSLALLLFLVSKLRREVKTYLLALFAGVPVIILWAPLIYNLFVALTLSGIWMVVVFVVLPLGLLLPLLAHVSAKRWLLPSSLAFASVVLLLAGVFISGFDQHHPKTNNLIYALNANRGKAIFASSDQAADDWTRPFLATGTERGTMDEFFPRNDRVFMKSPAAAVALPGPDATLTSDSRQNGMRTVTLHLVSQRTAPVLSVYTEGDTEIVDASINGKQVMPVGNGSVPMRDWAIQFHGLPEKGIDLVLKTKGDKPYKVLLVDRSYGLGDTVGPRAPYMISSPHSPSDVTLISKSFSF